MRKTIRRIVMLSAVGAALIASPAAAEEPAKGKVAAAKEKRAEARAKTNEARDKVKDAIKKTVKGEKGAKAAREEAKKAREEAKEARGEAREATGEAHKALRARWKKLRETRKERRKERRAKIKEKWGEDALKRPAVRAALRVHARRKARLHRIRALAKAADKTAIVERVDKLIAKEDKRHNKHMEVLKAQPAGAK